MESGDENNDMVDNDENNDGVCDELEMKIISNYRDIFAKMNIDRGLNVQECEMDIYKNYRGRWSKN